MEIPTTEKIAKFVVETDYNDIPKEGIKVAKKAILDCLGVAIAGSKEPGPKILVEQVKQTGAVGEATVICGGFRTSADLAAWVNGTASHALDYDDTFPSSAGWNFHPTVPILPAVLALGEKYDVSGIDILTSYIVGIEVESRVGSAIGLFNSELGWHTTSVMGTIGAAAASAKILKLNVLQTQMALGVAGSLAGGLRHNFGTMTKSFQAGNAARNGVVATLLAKNGFTANESILEGQFGFFNLFSGGNESGLRNNEEGLKGVWHIISPGISFKPYPSCRSTHSSIDAALHIRSEFRVDADQVIGITCKTSPLHTQLSRFHRPRSGYEGKFSIPYCIAIALLRGGVSLEDFTDEKVNETRVQDLLSKVNYLYPEDWPTGNDLTQEVVVHLKDGEKYSHRVVFPKGEPENPMTEEELIAKFKDCVCLSLSQLRTERMLEMITNLESLDRISRLMEVLE